MNLAYICSQIVGLAGVACFIGSYQIKSNTKLYLAQLIGNFLFMIQFLLLGKYVACILIVVTLVRNAILMKIHTPFGAWKGWVPIFIAIFIGSTAFSYTCIFDIFPCIAQCASTVGLWTNNAQKIRLWNLFAANPAWITYDLWAKAYSGVLNESLMIISAIISIIRYGWKEMGDPESDFQTK